MKPAQILVAETRARSRRGGSVLLAALIVLAASRIQGADRAFTPRLETPAPVRAALVDSQATAATRALMAALVADYGKRTWSGQYHDSNDMARIRDAGHLKPAILGGDFMDYSPSRVARGDAPTGYTEAMIAFGQAGYVITMSWHWNAPTNLVDSQEQPWWRGFYSIATTFDVAAALADTNSTEYALILRDIDAIAEQLEKFSDAGVPILWRPLHEADGTWFWWGAKGPGPFKALWRLLYHRLTDEHHLHNLIWVYSGDKPDWYPGNDMVDIVGTDAYPKDPGDPLLSQWRTLNSRFNGVKLVALTEFGGVPDVERMQASGVWWSYFASWTASTKAVPGATIARIYGSPAVVTMDQLRNRPNVGSTNPPTAAPRSK